MKSEVNPVLLLLKLLQDILVVNNEIIAKVPANLN
jgi:hypothetical protein